MKLHKESKGTIIVASIVFAVIAFISISLIAMAFLDQYRVLVLSTGIAAFVVMLIGILVQSKAKKKLLQPQKLERSYF